MHPATNPDRQLEAELIARIAAGEEAAFAQLYDRFAPGLFSLVLRMVRDQGEAEDVLQEGFTLIWRRAATYDATRSSPFTWAVMLLRHKAIDRIRVRDRFARTAEAAAFDRLHFPEADDASSGGAAAREDRAIVRSALNKIADDQKVAVELAFLGGMTHEEIAAKLGEPLGTVKARIRRGLLRLREILKGLA